jgi:transketolase
MRLHATLNEALRYPGTLIGASSPIETFAIQPNKPSDRPTIRNLAQEGSMATLSQLITAKAIAIGKLAVRATTAAGSGHPTTALSLAHLTATLMYHTMRWRPEEPRDPGADRLVLSEGHAVPIVYAACADLGVTFFPHGQSKRMTVDDLMTLREIDSPIDGHPNPALGFPFFDAATGSLGQGLSVAGGLGCAARIDAIDKVVYCIIGDGESREGQIWEAMDFIRDQRLSNVVAIFNCNELGQSDFVSHQQDWTHLQRKAEAFGWATVVIDGHDPDAILAALGRRTDLAKDGRALAIIARTVKGWGVPSIEGTGHHGTPVPKDQLDSVLKDLDQRAKELGVAAISQDDMTRGLPIAQPTAKPSAPPAARPPAGFMAAVAGNAKVAKSVEEKKVLSPRRAFGLALKALGAANPRIVALDGDVKNSTYVEDFAKAYPERYFEGRIAEQNMVSAGAGLAAAGKIAFVSTFGRFMERAFDEIEMAIISGLPIKVVGTHIGVTLAADGPSQMALADVAFMRALAHADDYRGSPGMTVLTPSDPVSAYNLVVAMAEHPGACYLRAVRGDLPILYSESERFPFGGHKVVRRAESDRPAVVLAATGYLVHSCLKAADALRPLGIDTTVIDAYALPLDAAPLLRLARSAGAPILTVEDSYVGGIGSEIAEAAAASSEGPRVRMLAVRNIPKSGRTPDDVLAYVHLSVPEIVQAAKTLTRETGTSDSEARRVPVGSH